MKRTLENRHFFHIVNNSPWPFLITFPVLGLTLDSMFWFHFKESVFFLYCLIITVLIMAIWFRDVIREGTFEGNHTKQVQNNLKFGMFLFIISEVMFFFSFFWTFFHSSLSPVFQIGIIWPPYEIIVLKTWKVPALNTAILLTSGASITWAHYALLKNDRKEVINGFLLTLFLAVLFTMFQAMEYKGSTYHMFDGIYGSIFFLITGFHGLHVLIGTFFLIVCLLRFCIFHFTVYHHVGFQAASWYWHFVDVVWILLFISVYVWGNYSKTIDVEQEFIIFKDSLQTSNITKGLFEEINK